ncbi:MAG: prepilin-type N-terminal cleavage/methylation domain-containing protein [Gemmatimonadota bacterium]
MSWKRENRKGVTFIELLTVVVIIGLLSVFALPRMARNKEKASIATMESDLRNLATAEESYYYNNSIYTIDQIALNITLSAGNTLVINEATPAGWSATISHTPAVTQNCYLFHGSATPVGSSTTEGVIDCS